MESHIQVGIWSHCGVRLLDEESHTGWDMATLWCKTTGWRVTYRLGYGHTVVKDYWMKSLIQVGIWPHCGVRLLDEESHTGWDMATLWCKTTG